MNQAPQDKKNQINTAILGCLFLFLFSFVDQFTRMYKAYKDFSEGRDSIISINGKPITKIEYNIGKGRYGYLLDREITKEEFLRIQLLNLYLKENNIITSNEEIDSAIKNNIRLSFLDDEKNNIDNNEVAKYNNNVMKSYLSTILNCDFFYQTLEINRPVFNITEDITNPMQGERIIEVSKEGLSSYRAFLNYDLTKQDVYQYYLNNLDKYKKPKQAIIGLEECQLNLFIPTNEKEINRYYSATASSRYSTREKRWGLVIDFSQIESIEEKNKILQLLRLGVNPCFINKDLIITFLQEKSAESSPYHQVLFNLSLNERVKKYKNDIYLFLGGIIPPQIISFNLLKEDLEQSINLSRKQDVIEEFKQDSINKKNQLKNAQTFIIQSLEEQDFYQKISNQIFQKGEESGLIRDGDKFYYFEVYNYIQPTVKEFNLIFDQVTKDYQLYLLKEYFQNNQYLLEDILANKTLLILKGDSKLFSSEILKKIFKGEKGDYIYEQRESGIYVYRVINKIKEQDITQLSKKLVKYFEEYQIHRLIQKKYQINVFDKEQYYVK
jgi:hypothetical protein